VAKRVFLHFTIVYGAPYAHPTDISSGSSTIGLPLYRPIVETGMSSPRFVVSGYRFDGFTS